LSKIEKNISFWCNRWLSKGGRLVLINSMLEVIPIYWHTLAHIPRGILEKIRNFLFNSLWKGSSDYKGSHLVKWKRIATSRSIGARG
jgi:hypothetical protein